MRYKPVRGPDFGSSELRRLTEWLSTEFNTISAAFDRVTDFDRIVSRTQPDGNRLKDREGMLRYGLAAADGTDPDIEPGHLNLFDGTEWQVIADGQSLLTITQWVVDHFVTPGYGGLRMGAPWIVGSLGASWVLVAFDAEAFVSPKNVTQSIANASLVPHHFGTWVLSVYFNMDCTEQQSGRRMQLQMWNLTLGAPVSEILNIGVGRNQDNLNWSIALPFEVDKSIEGHEVALRIRSETDTFSGVLFRQFRFSLHHVSGYEDQVQPA